MNMFEKTYKVNLHVRHGYGNVLLNPQIRSGNKAHAVKEACDMAKAMFDKPLSNGEHVQHIKVEVYESWSQSKILYSTEYLRTPNKNKNKNGKFFITPRKGKRQ